MNRRFFPLHLPSLLLAALLAGCAGNDIPDQPPSAQELFYDGVRLMYIGGNYEGAIERFRQIQARYPFGAYATQAHLELVYAHYLAGDKELAVEEADRFILENPRHQYVDYAYYMKGLAHYSGAEPNFLEDMFDVDPAQQSNEDARKAFQNFQQLVSTYPDSPYADDARQRMIHLRNFLARYEWYVADYYFRRGAYVASVNRAKRIVENFPTTPSAPQALALMAESYRKMNMPELAAAAEQAFRASYPDRSLREALRGPEADDGWF